MRFALDHPGHYEVMFDKSLYDDTDAELVAAASAAGAELNRGVGTLTDPQGRRRPGERRAGRLVSGARIFDAVAQRRDRHRGRSDRQGAESGRDPVRRTGPVASGR